jgi:hypothetical protein
VQEHVIERLASTFSRANEDTEIFARRLLTNELVKGLGPKR